MKINFIAEAGVNHNGDINLAKKLIDVAAEANVNFIKFQTFKAESLATRYAPKANYQNNTTPINESQYEMLKKLELSSKMHDELISYCKLKKVEFLSSAFDIESLDYLNSIGVKIFKIPSGEITNLPYLRHVGSFKKKIILSTGMSTMEEILNALDIFEKSGTKKSNITILHCNTEYPTPVEDVNLNAMISIKEKTGCMVGYSDHTLGNEVSISAVALGASLIEKHITLDRKLKGPDHKASIEPKELYELVRLIKNTELALGDKIKKPSKSEEKNIIIARKSIVAKKRILKGDFFTEKNITVKRPGNGLSPMLWDSVIGIKAIKDFEKDQLIEI